MKGEFNKYIQNGQEFLKAVSEDLQVNEDTAYRTIKSVFHTIREILTPEESLHLVSQLPMLLKGVYVDNWKLSQSGNYKNIHDKEDFLNEFNAVQERIDRRNFGSNEEAQRNFEIVFNHLKKYIAEGELKHVIAQLPGGVKELIPA